MMVVECGGVGLRIEMIKNRLSCSLRIEYIGRCRIKVWEGKLYV